MKECIMTVLKTIENTEHEEFISHLSEILADMPDNIIKDYNFEYLNGNELPWRETGINVELGEKITIIAKGKVDIFKKFNISFRPHLQLWFRIGENGDIFNGPQDTFTFTAKSRGNIYLANYLQDWVDIKGKTNRDAENNFKRLKAQGGISILVIQWKEDPLEGLEQLAIIGDYDNLLKNELERLLNPVPAPEGWKYLWSVGESDVFKECSKNKQVKKICCHTKGQAAILQKDINFTLKKNTLLNWSWKIDKLPSEKAENMLFYHDYFSVAVEFDDGQDITYHWSSELPVETTYRCPFPTWNSRETHIVIRSGKEGLKNWIDEQRNIYDDYQKAIGPPPERIVRVWLIASTQIQNAEGKIEFSNIKLECDKTEIKIL